MPTNLHPTQSGEGRAATASSPPPSATTTVTARHPIEAVVLKLSAISGINAATTLRPPGRPILGPIRTARRSFAPLLVATIRWASQVESHHQAVSTDPVRLLHGAYLVVLKAVFRDGSEIQAKIAPTFCRYFSMACRLKVPHSVVCSLILNVRIASFQGAHYGQSLWAATGAI